MSQKPSDFSPVASSVMSKLLLSRRTFLDGALGLAGAAAVGAAAAGSVYYYSRQCGYYPYPACY